MATPLLPAPSWHEGLDRLSAVSPTFRSELEALTKVGAYYSDDFTTLSMLLGEVFFHEIGPKKPTRDLTGDFLGTVQPFDPNSSPPGTFEQQFGDEYFHLP